MKNFFKKIKNTKKGFSLVETLVALFVFSIAITATMAVMSQGVTNINSAKNKVIASFLAQEGIEYFRNIRDIIISRAEDKNTEWGNLVSTVGGLGCETNGCFIGTDERSFGIITVVDDINFVINQCLDGNNCIIQNTISNGVYFQPNDGIINTSFVRKIYFQKINDDNLKVICEVSYTQNGKTNTVSFTDYLTNWAE